MASTIKVTFRDLAKMLVKALPVEGREFKESIESYIKAIQKLSAEQKTALKSAYLFSAKAPREEREDLFQELALALLKAGTKDEKLAYSIARCDWLNWWRKFKIRSHYSLDIIVEDENGHTIPYGELLVGDVEFENRMNGNLDGEALYNKLPTWVKNLVNKRLQGYPLRGGDRQILNKWVASKPMILAEYQN